MLKIIGSPPEVSENELEFFIFFDVVGFVHGKCRMLWVKSEADEDTYTAGFVFTKISSHDMGNLQEGIRRFGHIMEEREIF